jgi:hypothetical protein
MAGERKAGGKGREKARLILRGMGPDDERGPVEVIAFDRGGKRLEAVSVAEDGTFRLSDAVIDEAHRIKIGPGGEAAVAAPVTAFLTYRAVDFRAALETGVIDVAPGVWRPWFPFVRCVSGTVRRCYPGPWWYLDLATMARSAAPSIEPGRMTTGRRVAFAEAGRARIAPAPDLDRLIAWPRCTKICLGTVEVYRRVCCCKPWIVFDPRLPGLVEELEDIVRGIPEVPVGPPGPQPDPAPVRDAFFAGGALAEHKLRAAQDLAALRSLPAERVPHYVNAHPYLICRSYSCGAPVKVAEGTIGPDGRFNVCWRFFPFPLSVGCHEQFAYRVKQQVGPFTFTIYDGVAAGQWFGADDEPTLTSYHPFAVACRDNGGPGDAFVYLDVIGDTGSHHLGTPDQDSASSVQAPAANSGVVFPAGGPPGGTGVDRNWGGTLKLSIMFSESMRDIGATHYRVSVTAANANGDPVGNREYVSAGLSWTKAVASGGGVDIVPVSLGPVSIGGVGHLYEIPYDGALAANEDWEDHQYHVHLDTSESRWSDPTVRHLVTIEVFNAAAQRLRPNGTPATGLGGPEATAAFTFRRKFQEIGPTDMVPYGALTHMFWWDNRDVEALIEDLRMNGVEFDEECQFLSGTAASTFGIGYRAYHPVELFQRDHAITWKRGLSGGTGTLLPPTHANLGVPPAPPAASPTASFGTMLGLAADPTRTKCAFTVFLRTVNKRTDGDDLGYTQAWDSAAFALEVGGP